MTTAGDVEPLTRTQVQPEGSRHSFRRQQQHVGPSKPVYTPNVLHVDARQSRTRLFVKSHFAHYRYRLPRALLPAHIQTLNEGSTIGGKLDLGSRAMRDWVP